MSFWLKEPNLESELSSNLLFKAARLNLMSTVGETDTPCGAGVYLSGLTSSLLYSVISLSISDDLLDNELRLSFYQFCKSSYYIPLLAFSVS